ncbi:MAG TPA: hypothetical protein VGX96_16400, partial [Candidatus Elarobacter sp.]|nr:hypothetical protein [Candidatus Elarobacter sp.]
RDLGDALKRRCLHLYIGYPDSRLEERIVDVHVPGVDARLRAQLVAFVQRLRTLELKKLPSVSETIDWARVVMLLHVDELSPELVHETLNVLLKFQDDVLAVTNQVAGLVLKARDAVASG